MKAPTFVLASASPARQRLLQSAGIDPLIHPSDFDESQVQTSDPVQLVETLARCKAETVAQALEPNLTTPTLVLGCDSVLVVQEAIHGKPANSTEAIARWQMMRGKFGDLYTGHALIELNSAEIESKTLVRHQVTRVYFADISDHQIVAYIATGEPINCAGCFTLEGKGGLLIEKLEGCHSNVIGLSLPLLRQMLSEFGHDVSTFWEA